MLFPNVVASNSRYVCESWGVMPPNVCFWSYFCNNDLRASIFTHENEEQTCFGPHFTQNNGGVRLKIPFEKMYQPYNGPTIRKFFQYLSEWFLSLIWVNIFTKFFFTKLGKPSKKNTIQLSYCWKNNLNSWYEAYNSNIYKVAK